MPRKLDKASRGSEVDVQVLLGMVVDVDCNHPLRGKTGYFDTVDQASDAILRLPIRPTMMVGSGFGVHAYWLWKEPWLLDPEERSRAKEISRGWNHAAARLLGKTVDSTFALNHIYRIPETTNWKYEERPLAQILYESEDRYDPTEFDPFAEASAVQAIKVPVLRPQSQLSEKVRNLIAFVPEFAEQWHHTARTGSDTSQSGWDWRMAQLMVEADLPDEDIADALVSNREHWKGKKKPARYYGVTIAKLRATPGEARPPKKEQPPSDEEDPERAWYSRLSLAVGVHVDWIDRSDVHGSIEDCTYWVNFRSGGRVVVRKDSQIRSYTFWTRTLRGIAPLDQVPVPNLPKGAWEEIIEKLWSFARIPTGSDTSLTCTMAMRLLAHLDQNEVAVDDINAIRRNDRRPLRYEHDRYFLKQEFLQWHQKSYGKMDESIFEEMLRLVHSTTARIGFQRLRYIQVEEYSLRREALGGEEEERGNVGEADDDRGAGGGRGTGEVAEQGDGDQSGSSEEGGGGDSVLYTH